MQIALPITNRLKTKGEGKLKPSQLLKCTVKCQTAFKKLKRLFSAESVLKHPESVLKPFIIQLDASDIAVGAVLVQENNEEKLCIHIEETYKNGAKMGSMGK